MRAIVIAIALATALTGSVGYAQIPQRNEAAHYAGNGLDAFDAGKYEEAIEHFEKAEALFHAPTHLSFMARSHDKLGRLEKARLLYQLIATEELPQHPSLAFRQAQADARKAFEVLDKRVPVLTVIIQGLAPEMIQLHVNGELKPQWHEQALRLDPGEYEVVASADGFIPEAAKVTLKEGLTEQISLILKRAKAAPSPSASAPPVEPDRADEGPWLMPPLIAFGVGAAGLVVGGVTGGLSLSKVGELDDTCPTKTNCDPAQQHLADDAETLGNVSTAFFIIGGVGVAAGTVLLFWQPFGDDDQTSARLQLGVGSLSVAGSF